ncbi:hypothetical protein QBC43DRAFT_313370 [Cladorrhinum sp. PSN259]|nr:hypothetical protein QBC43DRAFT_313370 [Cladorrhinum sp. PSN259]
MLHLEPVIGLYLSILLLESCIIILRLRKTGGFAVGSYAKLLLLSCCPVGIWNWKTWSSTI